MKKFVLLMVANLPPHLRFHAVPLYELSALMENLPIKRSLSRHYQGKSQSFSSLTNVKSIEDLVKIDKKPYKKKKSKLRIHNEASSDVPSLHVVRTSQQIGKRNPSGSSCSSLFSRNSSFINRRPPLQRNIL